MSKHKGFKFDGKCQSTALISSTSSLRHSRLTFVQAVIPVGMGSELLDGMAAQKAGVGGLGPERESCAT